MIWSRGGCIDVSNQLGFFSGGGGEGEGEGEGGARETPKPPFGLAAIVSSSSSRYAVCEEGNP